VVTLYVALAAREGCLFVTADEELMSALSATRHGRCLRWVDDLL
jgi:predicted nucleic acid-binding protein